MKKSEWPGLIVLMLRFSWRWPALAMVSEEDEDDDDDDDESACTPISRATETSCASVSAMGREGSMTDASICLPNFFPDWPCGAEPSIFSMISDEVEDTGEPGGLSSAGLAGVAVPDEVPSSCSRLYSIPLTLANS